MKLFSYTVDKSYRQEMLKSTYINILHCTVSNYDDDNNNNNNNNNNDNDDTDNDNGNDNDKETNIWTLFEATVCQVDNNAERFEEKQTKYIELRAGIKREYKSIDVYQFNLIYCF